jgi:hypothetical protein
MKDSEKGFMIRAGSTTTSFAKRLAEHFNCSKLKKDADKKSKLYESRKGKIGLRTKLPRLRLTACALSSILNVPTFEVIFKYL